MRPELRLAIKTLSARRSRSLLLVAVVAFSCALVIGISGTLEALNGAIAGHVSATVGDADVRVRSSTSDKVFDAAVLERVRAWKGVASASGRMQAAVTLSAERDVLRKRDDRYVREPRRFLCNAQANGNTLGTKSLPLLAGRHAEGPGEVVVDALLAAQMSWRGMSSRERAIEGDPVTRRGRPRDALGGKPPVLPEGSDRAEEAHAMNALVGVRVGETVNVVRQALPPVSISAVLANPARALRMIKSMGTTFQMPGLKGLAQQPQALTVVGVAAPPPLGGRAQCYMTLDALNALLATERAAGVDQIDVLLDRSVDPEAFVREHASELGEGFLVQTAGKVTAGLDRNMEAGRLGVLFATVLGFLASSFIIMTGMTTGVTERQRELGMLRAIGASRGQLARSQLFGGAIVGVLGAVVGLPLGAAVAWGLVQLLRLYLEVSFVMPPSLLAIGAGGALASGLIGAAFPAWRAAGVSPLEALASRAAPARPSRVALLAVVGVVLALVQVAIITLVKDGQRTFWLYALVGLPALFTGYFLMAVPVTCLTAKLLGGLISRALAVPPSMLKRSVLNTPYRHGFTAGSLMAGLSLMVAIWTQGGAIRRDWLGKIEFPDAFVTGLNLTPQSRETLEGLSFVESVTAIAIKPVEVDAFGVQALQKYKTSFMAFEPRRFFKMTKITWVEGDEATAIERLERGGAVIVAREFQIAKGLGVGDEFVCRSDGVEHRFDIVGVVTSPGLEMVSKFFNVGEDFTDQAMHAVFGSRKDLKEKLKSESIHLLQVKLKPGIDDDEAVDKMRDALAGAGILDAGSGRKIKELIVSFADGAIFAVTLVGFAAMIVAGFGVANVIVAGIQSRQYEFGVVRALGAGRWMVSRLVLAEAVVIAIAASIVGTAAGVQAALGDKRLDEAILGIRVNFELPWDRIAIGWGLVLLLSLAAAAPAVIALGRRAPRELLASMKGG
ncbi:MAG: ABC transporter permease [Phycisphaerales bacterium]